MLRKGRETNNRAQAWAGEPERSPERRLGVKRKQFRVPVWDRAVLKA